MKELNLKVRQELIDYDYIDKLSNKEKSWLNQFNAEYINADFRNKEERIHPKKYTTKVVKRTGKKKQVDINKKDCEDRNNKRNNDIHGISKVNNLLSGEDKFNAADWLNRSTSPTETEEAIIEYIDNKFDLMK